MLMSVPAVACSSSSAPLPETAALKVISSAASLMLPLFVVPPEVTDPALTPEMVREGTGAPAGVVIVPIVSLFDFTLTA